MNILKIAISMSLFTCGSLLSSAYAANTQNLTNTATYASTCTITSGGSLNFGSYDTLSSVLPTASSSFTVKCTKGNYQIKINSGENSLVYWTEAAVSMYGCQPRMKNTTVSNNYVYYSIAVPELGVTHSQSGSIYIPIAYAYNETQQSQYCTGNYWVSTHTGYFDSRSPPAPTITFSNANETKVLTINGRILNGNTFTSTNPYGVQAISSNAALGNYLDNLTATVVF